MICLAIGLTGIILGASRSSDYWDAQNAFHNERPIWSCGFAVRATARGGAQHSAWTVRVRCPVFSVGSHTACRWRV